jgi:hypothetical protein
MKIPRWIKISSAVAAMMIVAVAVGLYFYVKTIDFDLYADLAADRIEAIFQGQPFTVKGITGLIERILKKDNDWPLSFDIRIGGASAKVQSILDWRSTPPLINGAIEIDIADTDGLEKLVGTPFELPLPLTLKAEVKFVNSQYLIEPFSTGIGESTISGNIAIQTNRDRPLVKASLKASDLDLSRRGPSKNKTAKADGRVFSDKVFPLDVLRVFDAQVEARIDRLILPNKLPMQDLEITATLRIGRLEIDPLAASVGGGKLTANLTLETATSKMAALEIKAEGKGVSGEALAASMGYADTVAGGSTDLNIHVTGPGVSLARFMAAVNGEARLVVGSTIISSAAFDWGGDVLTRLLNLVIPFDRSEKITHLSCMVIRLPTRDGIAVVDRTIAAETNRLNVVAAGQIDLRDEMINLGFKTRAKEGIGIGAVNLAELVKLSGSLSNPEVGVDTIESAKEAVSVGGALATGGLSLIAEAFLKKATDDPHPCRTALSRGGPTSLASPAKEATVQEKKKGSGVVDSLKNLF